MENVPEVADTLRQTDLPEREMINRDKHGAIKALAERGTPKKEIARILDVSVKSVRRILAREKWSPYQRRVPEQTVLTGFTEFLGKRAGEVGFNGAVLFTELKFLGYKGGYGAVKDFVRPLREAFRRDAMATLRFETAPGRQGQADWGSSYVWFGSQRVRIHFFALVLGYSRRMFAKGFKSERLLYLVQGHEAAFAWFGGSPHELLYDNPRTMVKKRTRKTETEPGEIELNPTFRDFVRHYGFTPRFCQPYRAQTKGKIESGVKYIKRNFLAGRRFHDLDDLNRQLEGWLNTVADVRVHGTTGVRPIDRFPQEKLLDFANVPPYRIESPITRKVPGDARVSFETNRYSVPWRFIGRQVEIRPGADEVVLLCDGKEIARHARLTGKHQEKVDLAHFRDLFREETGLLQEPLHDPRFVAEEVMVRDLGFYDQVAGIGGHV